MGHDRVHDPASEEHSFSAFRLEVSSDQPAANYCLCVSDRLFVEEVSG